MKVLGQAFKTVLKVISFWHNEAQKVQGADKERANKSVKGDYKQWIRLIEMAIRRCLMAIKTFV